MQTTLIYIIIDINHSIKILNYSYRQEIIERLQAQHSLVILVTNSLTTYMEKIKQIIKGN